MILITPIYIEIVKEYLHKLIQIFLKGFGHHFLKCGRNITYIVQMA
jgi:hypothetical protein